VILQSTSAALSWVSERDGSCSFVCDDWYAYTGQTAAEALGCGWLEAVHPDDRADVGARLRSDAGGSVVLRFRLRGCDGRYREVSGSAWPRYDARGAFVGYAGSFAELGPSHASPAVAPAGRAPPPASGTFASIGSNAHRERLADLFDLSPSFACVLSGPDFVYEAANEPYFELIGRRDVIGKPLREVFPEIVGQGIVEQLEQVYRTGVPLVGTDVRVVLRRADGREEERFIDYVLKPLHDCSGRVNAVFAQGIDLTEHKRTEAALRAQDERFQLLINNVRDYAVVITDAQGRIVDWQGGAERITGHTAAEAIGQSAELLFTPEDRAAGAFQAELDRARAEGRAEDHRWHLRKDGTLFFANGATVRLCDEHGNLHGFGKVFQDETARQREAERRVLLLQVARRILESRSGGADMAEAVFGMIAEPLGADMFFNYKIDDGERLVLVKGAGYPPGLDAAVQRVRLGQTVCGKVAKAKEACAVDAAQIAVDPACTFVRSLGVRAYACYPLLSGDGRVLGTFSVGSTRRDAFQPEEVDFLLAVSHLLALAWEREQAEQSLARLTEESERRRRLYETILTTTPDLVFVFDLDHRFQYANDPLLRLWGRSWDEAIGRTCWELGYEPWHAEMHDRELEHVKATRQPVRGIVPFEGTAGRRLYDYIFVPVLGPDGEVEAIAGATRDVTELKQSQEESAALLEQEKLRAEQLARVADASRRINALLSPESICRVLAEEARLIIGAHQAVASLTQGDDWAQSVTAVAMSDKYAAWRHYGEKPDGSGIYTLVCESNQPMRMTQEELEAHPAWKHFGPHRDSHPPMRGWLAAPLVGHGGKNLGLVQLSDKYEGEFTEEDEAMLMQLAAIAAAGLENANLYERLREEDRRKDEFLATLAHELRNPLAPIRSGLAVLDLAPGADVASQTRAIMKRQVEHMVRLIDDLLDISRITSGKVQLRRERVEVQVVVDDALEVSRPAIGAARHELVVSLPEEPLLLDADRTRIAQVISNLLNNAAKYTPEGGRIELAVERDDTWVVIRVCDNGMGLTPETIEDVFDLFTQVGKTLDRAQGGLGIGLALVKRLVEMHGGKVKAESDGPGRGSTFTVRLPLAPDPVVPADRNGDAHGERRPQSATSRLRVLVVDDNIDAAATLALQLQLSGHEVRTAHNGRDALVLARAFVPDAAFLDIGLPGMDGYELAHCLRSAPETRSTVLVAVTGWGGQADYRRAIDSGFDHHLTKPATAGRIEEILASLALQQRGTHVV